MDIRLDVFLGNLFTCPCCGKPTPPCGFEEETWFHEDFFGYATYLNARVPQLQCSAGILSADRPWSRTGSRFSRLLPTGAVVTALAAGELEPGAEAGVPHSTSESRVSQPVPALALSRNC
ncbi:transposase family protein [Geomonas limicola]|nr:transposase family protein [Geomonas limicola]